MKIARRRRGKKQRFGMLKCIFVKEIQHFRSPIPQNVPPAAGISLAFKGEIYLYPHLCYYFQKKIHTTKVFKNRNGEFPEKLPEMFRIFWLRWQLQYSKTTRKKTPESKNRNDEFPENHQKCFGFFGSDSSRSILEPPKKGGNHHKDICA